ncbi:MAG: TonB-dependent receptor [Gemmataceae bacterium]|nr:TonB-dependent receptor [Gemmataceae bacterium]
MSMGRSCRYLFLLGPLLASCVPATPAFGQARLLPPVDFDQPLAVAQEKPIPEKKDDLFKLDLERLMQVPVAPATPSAPTLSGQQLVSTVSRQESTVAQSPAAIFVITQDMIRRSGATSIPEVLRMAPGLQVARIDSSRWAITARGFSERFSGKLLVQIDGRVVYNVIFSGVYWDVQDLLLQDIERIEVIRGPGATIWGSNAVNGIINIITKRAQDTQGALVTGGGGTFDRGFAGVRHGGKLGEDLYYRVWGKWFEHGPGSYSSANLSGDGLTHDDWRQGFGGFRLDWEPSTGDTVTLQSDWYRVDAGRSDTRPSPIMPPSFVFNNIEDERSRGGNVLWRWRHEASKDTNWTLQAYWDHFNRDASNRTFDFRIDTVDLDFQHQFPLTCRQKLIYGLGYRLVDVNFQGSQFDGAFAVGDAQRSLNLYTGFVQDEFTLVKDRLLFIAGSKFEHNAFTGFEYQPTGRLLWSPDEQHSIWGAVSRAVRIPNVGEVNLSRLSLLPAFPAALPPGTPVFGQFVPPLAGSLEAEDLIAYELGYRAQPTTAFSWDLALFTNIYRHLITPRPGAALVPGPVPGTFVQPLPRENGVHGEGYGAELAVTYQVAEWWRVYAQYTYLHLFLHRAAGLPESAEFFETVSPHNQVYVQSSFDLGCRTDLDIIGRYVENLPGFTPEVRSYLTMDVRLAWRPRPNLEIAVVGQNLLDSRHLEHGTSQILTNTLVEIPRGVYGMITWRW